MTFAGTEQQVEEQQDGGRIPEPSVYETGSERRRTAISENIFPEVAKADVAEDETLAFPLLFLLGLLCFTEGFMKRLNL